MEKGEKNAKQYSIPYGWSMCNSELFCIPVAVMKRGWGNNLELEFKDELCVSCALCQVYSEG